MTILAPFSWTWRAVRRLRDLVQDEDHDEWLDSHAERERPDKKLNPGIFLGGTGGTGGGGA
jgi:hypothetical protein